MAKVEGMRGKDNSKPVFVKKGAPNTGPTFRNNHNNNIFNNNKRPNVGRDYVVDKKVKVEGRQLAENCKFCDKLGHRAEQCWKKLGACLRCGGCDHRIPDCPMLKDQPCGAVTFGVPGGGPGGECLLLLLGAHAASVVAVFARAAVGFVLSLRIRVGVSRRLREPTCGVAFTGAGLLPVDPVEVGIHARAKQMLLCRVALLVERCDTCLWLLLALCWLVVNSGEVLPELFSIGSGGGLLWACFCRLLCYLKVE
ncbi:hypothetical protein Taro_021819, partial [Colocasia esculenta]|nr:hypothetical protein [Colocasia esculenta]